LPIELVPAEVRGSDPPAGLLRPRPAHWYFDRASALLWLANARGSCSPPTSPRQRRHPV